MSPLCLSRIRISLTSPMQTGSYLGEFFSAIKQVLAPDLSLGSGFLVRIPRRNWMHLFPWLRLYYCPQSKTTRLYSRARVDEAREELAVNQPRLLRNLASKTCTQPWLEESSIDKEIPMLREKVVSRKSGNSHLDDREIASLPVSSKQRRTLRRARAISLRAKQSRLNENKDKGTTPATDGQIHIVVRVELAGLPPGIRLDRSTTDIAA
jgi:hypothetical protein